MKREPLATVDTRGEWLRRAVEAALSPNTPKPDAG